MLRRTFHAGAIIAGSGTVVTGGIGAGALSRPNQMGIRVHSAQAPTVRENLELFASGSLPEYALQGCCCGHGHGRRQGGCAH